MNRKISIALISFILFLIFFDAVQQKYYIETFSLRPEGTELSLITLFKHHFIRWLIWGTISFPFGVLVWRQLLKRSENVSKRILILISVAIPLSTFVSLCSISIQSIVDQELVFEVDLFLEFLTFFTFQKGLTFLMASITLTLLLYNQSREKTIASQFIEIKDLKRKSSNLEEALNFTTQEEPHLNIKTGHKFQPIALSEIIWIQSDDYCVKIHTENQAFTLRKSMKALEEQLAQYGFIRIHRAALLNMNFFQQVNFDSSRVKLINTAELPISKAGAKALKKKLEESSL
ncbi:MAG: LytTR family DNA-binding domain-containing protein [Ekhidna sp.]